MKATLLINGIELVIEADKPKELIREISFWQSLPQACPLCSEPLAFTYRTPQDFEYYGMICGNLHACNFGQNKDARSLFYKNDWKDVREFQNAELGDYSAHPNAPRPDSPQQAPIATRILNVTKAIKELGGRTEAISAGETEQDYFESLVGQWNNLKGK